MTFRHHPLIGTTVEIRVLGVDDTEAARIDRGVVEEMRRLEQIFSAFVPDSELARWKRDELDHPSPELREVLGAALDWQRRSDGRFNPLAGVLSRVWSDAETRGHVPNATVLADAASSIVEPRYDIVEGMPVRTGDCTDLNLNAIAKGFIVDRALATVAAGSATVMINAGGDLAHRGDVPIEVGVENPLRPYDNEPPIRRLRLMNAAVATSGGARRGFRIGGVHHSHVIDPRDGSTADQLASITVRSADAMTADVAATVLGVVEPSAAIVEAAEFGVDCLVVDRHGAITATSGLSAG